MKKTTTLGANAQSEHTIRLRKALRFLSAEHVILIDKMLAKVSPFGEVTLRVAGGKLKFAAQSKSYDAFELQRRSMKNEARSNKK